MAKPKYYDNFIKAAEKAGQLKAMKFIMDYQEKHEPNSVKRYAAIFDVAKRSTTNRFYLFDGLLGSFMSMKASHGSGSEGDSNDGYATVFSNTPNSRMTSLGIYKCAETYIGKNGRSLKLDGLESTNSKARERAVVIHGANYVNDKDAGDSWGCPALMHSIAQEVIDKLKLGSYLYIYYETQNEEGLDTPVLRIGSEGEAVKTLQKLLGVKDDGKFGAITQAAVLSFQSSHAILADGIVGPVTWAVLLSDTPAQVAIDTKKPDWALIASKIKLDAEPEKINYVAKVAKNILTYISKYKAVEAKTGVPWDLIASIHFMEASNNFTKNLMNGQVLTMKTTIVPKGKGPWKTWEAAAIEAMEYDKLAGKPPGYWTFAKKLEHAEKYNGTGYRSKGMLSPYVTSHTNMSNEMGKYVSDGKFDANAPHTRPGVASIILWLTMHGYL